MRLMLWIIFSVICVSIGWFWLFASGFGAAGIYEIGSPSNFEATVNILIFYIFGVGGGLFIIFGIPSLLFRKMFKTKKEFTPEQIKTIERQKTVIWIISLLFIAGLIWVYFASRPLAARIRQEMERNLLKEN